ncbi:hypothetical protein RMCBS344292_14451 [Rhizopus microsporus]|nr:hypothetical protein RMCBS344292_14451 [Rhizopus microsporus]
MRTTEFVRQIPAPAIKYLKKESWPVYNKYIDPSLDRAVFKHRIHIAAEPGYVVPESERQPIASTSSHPRQAREIVSEAKRRYQPKGINRHQKQEQSDCPTPVLEPRKPTASTSSTLSLPPRLIRPAFFSSFGDLKPPDRHNSTKPSSGTADAHCQPAFSDNSIHPLVTSGASTKRKFDAVVPSAMNANKEPKAVAASSEVGHCTAASQAAVTGTSNAFTASAVDADDTHDSACPVPFVQESHPLNKFKELAMRHPMRVMKMAVKQRKVLYSLKGKEALDFVPRHPHSSSHGAPPISKPAAQFPSIPSISKGKGKELSLHRPSSSTMSKLPASNPASEVSAVTSAAPNKPTAISTMVPMNKVEDEEPEEGEIVDPSPPHKIQQAYSKHDNKPSCFKPNEAYDNESLSGSMAKGIPANSTAAPTKRVSSATAPNANTMEFCNLAHPYKQRGDGEQDGLVSPLSHLHALCNYIISYFYKEKQNPDMAPPESVAA